MVVRKKQAERSQKLLSALIGEPNAQGGPFLEYFFVLEDGLADEILELVAQVAEALHLLLRITFEVFDFLPVHRGRRPEASDGKRVGLDNFKRKQTLDKFP